MNKQQIVLNSQYSFIEQVVLWTGNDSSLGLFLFLLPTSINFNPGMDK